MSWFSDDDSYVRKRKGRTAEKHDSQTTEKERSHDITPAEERTTRNIFSGKETQPANVGDAATEARASQNRASSRIGEFHCSNNKTFLKALLL